MPGKPIRWESIGRCALLRHETRRDNAERKQRVHRKHEYMQLESYNLMMNSGRRKLESLEGAFRYFWEHSDFRLGYMQTMLVDEIKTAYLPNMFGEELVAHLKYLNERYAIDQLINTKAILFPRRSGKTVASAFMIALLCVSQPDFNAVMYSLVASGAEEFLAQAMTYMEVFEHSAEFGWTVDKRDIRKMIRIKTNKWGTLCSIKSYASALTGDAKK